MKQSESNVQEESRGFGHSRKRIVMEVIILLGGLLGLVLGALWLAKEAAGKLVRFVPPTVDRKLGEASFPLLAPTNLRCTSQDAKAYVEALAKPLIAALPVREFEFTFVVVDRPEINAFALPGGFVAVHMGLLKAAGSGEEIAAVLAHELHHVTLRHGTARILRQAGGSVVLGLVLGWAELDTLVSYSAELTSLAYDRDQEREADRHGLELLVKAGIHPGGMATFFRRLKDKHGDAAGIASFLATHPGLDERASEAAQVAPPTEVKALPAPPPGLACK
ncbi:MAG: M48 family metallopeptidase [Deltaproteobacteria bacterium]|nr:M48 family metallopeptidase [Deltaproteobacteria bacterium]